MTMNDCVQLGIYAGVIASIAAVVIQILVTLVFGDVAIEMMMRLVERMNVEMPPEFYELIEQAKEGEPNIFGAILSVFVYIIPNTLFSVLGALIGWHVFKPKT